MDIYWIKDKRQCGPSTVPDVISLLQMGELTPDTLGWHAGCTQWIPLRELPALADFLNKKAPEADEDEPAPSPEGAGEESAASEEQLPLPDTPEDKTQESHPHASQRVYLPSPTARLLARFVDYGLYAVLYGSIINLQEIPYHASLLLQVNPLLWLPMILLEAWMLSTWGTTPGKALLGIRVTTFGDAPRLSFLRAFARAFMVFCFGMGLMMPLTLLVMLAFSYWLLRRRGITSWDARCSTLPTQQAPATPSRYLLAVISLYVAAVLISSCLKPWLPGMIEDINKENPEMAQALSGLMPEKKSAPAPATAPQTPPEATPAPAVPIRQDTSLPGI